MIRAIVDANVWVSARHVFEAHLASSTVVEVARVLARPKLVAKYAIRWTEVTRFVGDLIAGATVHDVGEAPRRCRDADDDPLLELAIRLAPCVLVTGDDDIVGDTALVASRVRGSLVQLTAGFWYKRHRWRRTGRVAWKARSRSRRRVYRRVSRSNRSTRLPIAARLSGEVADLDALAHVLSAHALSAAESFSELISLGSLKDVERHDYQVETVQRVLKTLRGRALLADEVGLGKTIEALITLREYQLRGMVRRTLILAPPPLVGQWVSELQLKTGIVARHTDDPQLRLDPDEFWRGDGVVVASLALARAQRHAPAVQARPWDLVIVDEAHRVKNRQTLGWQLVNGLASRFLLLLTATPIENDLEELYQLATLLKPGQFATPGQFRKQFVDSKDPTSPRNRDALRRLLGEVMIRNTRAQCGLKLPPRYVTTVRVEPSDGERALYSETLDLLRAHAGDARARRAVATLLLEAGSSPHALRSTLERMRESDCISCASTACPTPTGDRAARPAALVDNGVLI